jgi:hypothetical protein
MRPAISTGFGGKGQAGQNLDASKKEPDSLFCFDNPVLDQTRCGHVFSRVADFVPRYVAVDVVYLADSDVFLRLSVRPPNGNLESSGRRETKRTT